MHLADLARSITGCAARHSNASRYKLNSKCVAGSCTMYIKYFWLTMSTHQPSLMDWDIYFEHAHREPRRIELITIWYFGWRNGDLARADGRAAHSQQLNSGKIYRSPNILRRATYLSIREYVSFLFSSPCRM